MNATYGYDIIIPTGNQIFDSLFYISPTFPTGANVIIASIMDSDGISNRTSYPITVFANPPIFTGVNFNNTAGSPSSAINVKRGASLAVTINGTDIEPNGNTSLVLSFSALEPGTNTPIWNPALQNIAPVTANTGFFNYTLAFPTSMPTGLVNLTVQLQDGSGAYADVYQLINIQNNGPIISGFFMNNQTDTQFIYQQGNPIIFTYNVSDVENQILFVGIQLVYSGTDPSVNISTVNYIIQYNGVGTNITINSQDLPVGIYTVYGFVIDQAGVEMTYKPGYNFSVTANTSNTPTLWLFFILGIIIGAIAAIAITYWRISEKISNERPRFDSFIN